MLTFDRYKLHIDVFAIARSGIHAITDWLYLNLDGPTIYLNNQQQDDPGYTTTWEADSLLADWTPQQAKKNIRLKFNYEWGQKFDNAIVIFENHNLDNLNNCHQEFGLPARHHKLLIIRSLRNHYASFIRIAPESRHAACRLRRFHNTDHKQAGIYNIDLWKMYAREALSPTDKTTIFYDRWCVDEGYRIDLLNTLDIKPKQVSMDGVPDYGGGSSFDGFSYSGQGSLMRTRDRWMMLTDEERLVLTEQLDDELCRLNDAIDSSLCVKQKA